MKKFTLMILSVLVLAVGCKKDKDNNVEIAADGKITGKLNGAELKFASVTSDIQTSGSSEVMYITANSNFVDYKTPTTNGKQLLVRVQPYKGVGTYTKSDQSFWVYRENINIVDAAHLTYKIHRYTDTETKGSMSLEITSDKTENGKRVVRGKFSGESGVTLQIKDYEPNKTLPLEAFALTSVNFIAPAKGK